MKEKQKRKEKRIIKIESKHKKKKDSKYITEKDHIRIEGADTSRLKP
jgi:tetrahydrodipicolinate N-succinyltransferase